MKARNNIVNEIAKKLPALKIADSAENADVVLVFGKDVETRLLSVKTTTVPGTNVQRGRPVYDDIEVATAYVVRMGERTSILISFKDERSNLFERKPETNFARALLERL